MTITVGDVEQAVSKAIDKIVQYGKPIVHIGFIPTIVVLGMLYTEPKPSIAQLLSPM